MAKREIYADDLTGREIEDGHFDAILSLGICKHGGSMPTPVTVTWDLGMHTAESLENFVKNSDLADFIVRMRPMVKIATPDLDVIRKWVKSAHPEIMVGDRGRMPAEVMALYRREVVNPVSAADAR